MSKPFSHGQAGQQVFILHCHGLYTDGTRRPPVPGETARMSALQLRNLRDLVSRGIAAKKVPLQAGLAEIRTLEAGMEIAVYRGRCLVVMAEEPIRIRATGKAVPGERVRQKKARRRSRAPKKKRRR